MPSSVKNQNSQQLDNGLVKMWEKRERHNGLSRSLKVNLNLVAIFLKKKLKLLVSFLLLGYLLVFHILIDDNSNISDVIPNMSKKQGEYIRALVENSEHNNYNNNNINGIVVFTVTWYSSIRDLRFEQCISTLRESSEKAKYPIVVVDGSPSEEVHGRFLELQHETESSIIVRRQTYKGGKGSALREAIAVAGQLPGVTDNTVLCWQEPEKTSMILDGWQTMFSKNNNDAVADAIKTADVMIPHRSEKSFHESYPIEQYHSETFGNLYLDAVMKDALFKTAETTKQQQQQQQATSSETLRMIHLHDDDDSSSSLSQQQTRANAVSIDWHFGPFCFRAKVKHLWTKYEQGDSYDSQLVPIVHAIRKGLTVISVHGVNFELDPRMKQQEEGNVAFIEKRLKQLNDLDWRVKKAWTDPFYC